MKIFLKTFEEFLEYYQIVSKDILNPQIKIYVSSLKKIVKWGN